MNTTSTQKKKKKKEKKQDVQTTGPILKEVPETLQPAPNESPRTIVRQEKKKGFFARFKSKSSGKKAQAESGKNQSGAQQKSTADCQEDSDDDDDEDEAGLSDKEKERLEQERIAFMKEIGYDERSKVQYPPEVYVLLLITTYWVSFLRIGIPPPPHTHTHTLLPALPS